MSHPPLDDPEPLMPGLAPAPQRLPDDDTSVAGEEDPGAALDSPACPLPDKPSAGRSA